MNAAHHLQEAIDRYEFMRTLAATPQDPIWHAEGDVLTHTRMVCDALERLPAFGSLPSREQEALRLAAVFHDCGKPSKTALGEDGRLHAPSHARVGAQLLRHAWWRYKAPVDAELADLVLGLIRYHSRPLHGEENVEVHAARTSVVTNCMLVAILAEADVRGRIGIADDTEKALLQIELFRMAAQELGCFETPYRWSNAHARYRFFQESNPTLAYQAFNDRKFSVHMTIGLPASGKSTWAAQQGLPIVSRDEIRRGPTRRTSLQPGKSKDEGHATQAFNEQVRENLRLERPFVIDGTNLLRSLRSNTIDMCVNYGAAVEIHFFDASRDVVLSRNRARKAVVPETYIERMAAKMEVPELTEAHSVTVHRES